MAGAGNGQMLQQEARPDLNDGQGTHEATVWHVLCRCYELDAKIELVMRRTVMNGKLNGIFFGQNMYLAALHMNKHVPCYTWPVQAMGICRRRRQSLMQMISKAFIKPLCGMCWVADMSMMR